jgi:hypothetical protein
MALMKKNLKVEFYSSFVEENKAEYQRRSQMSTEERIREFNILQERAWGKDWISKPIEKKATFEKVSW